MTKEGLPDANKRQTLRHVAAIGAVTPLFSMGTAAASEDGEDSDRRERIAHYVLSAPGSHFSKIRDDLSLGTGETQYHLDRLASESIIESRKDGDFRRYYAAHMFDSFEKRALAALRRETPRSVILQLLASPHDSPGTIATKLDLSPAAISKTARHLEEEQLLTRTNGMYAIDDPEHLIVLLVRFGDSFDADVHEFIQDVPSYIKWIQDETESG